MRAQGNLNVNLSNAGPPLTFCEVGESGTLCPDVSTQTTTGRRLLPGYQILERFAVSLKCVPSFPCDIQSLSAPRPNLRSTRTSMPPAVSATPQTSMLPFLGLVMTSWTRTPSFLTFIATPRVRIPSPLGSGTATSNAHPTIPKRTGGTDFQHRAVSAIHLPPVTSSPSATQAYARSATSTTQ
jgi:hypothetical protein